MNVVYILNELCADEQHHTDTEVSSLHWRVEGRHEVTSRRIDKLVKVQSDWREGLRYWVQSRISNFNEALVEVRSLPQREAWYSDTRACTGCRGSARDARTSSRMSGKTDGPTTGGQTPWRLHWRRHAQSRHACKCRTLTSSRGEASFGDAGVA